MQVSESKIDISIIIVSWNVEELLGNCLSSIYKHINFLNKEIIVIDNASSDNTTSLIKDSFKDIKLIENTKNKGFATACNQGIKESSGKFILLLNPDTELKEGFEKIISFFNKLENIGVVGCELVNEDGQRAISYQSFPTTLRIFTNYTGFNKFIRYNLVSKVMQPIFKLFPSQCKHMQNINNIEEVDSVVGGFFLCKRELYLKIGLLDENYFMYFEETDFCLRVIKAGCKNYFVPEYSIIHLGGKSAEKTNYGYLKLYTDSLLYFFRKNYSFLYYLFARIVLLISIFIKIIVINLLYFKPDKTDMLKVYYSLFTIG